MWKELASAMDHSIHGSTFKETFDKGNKINNKELAGEKVSLKFGT